MKSLKEYRFESNPLEKKLVDQFIKEHGKIREPDFIVFGHKDGGVFPNDYLSSREADIVVSTIQWLGSPVGQSFLNSCGFERTFNRNEP